MPNAKTVRLYREGLAQAGMIEALLKKFDGYLARLGDVARGGQILDASITRTVDRLQGDAYGKLARDGRDGRGDCGNRPYENSFSGDKCLAADVDRARGDGGYGRYNARRRACPRRWAQGPMRW